MIMVLTKELENKWCPSNKKHFESLGYTYTKMKDTFMVKFEDMPHSSDKSIKVECDYCGKKFDKQIKKYYRGRKIIPKDCCEECRSKKGEEARLKKYGTLSPLIHEGVKEKWIFDNMPKKEETLNKMIMTFKNNGCVMLPSIYVNNETKMPYICKKHIDKGIQWNNWIHLKSGRKCRYCAIESRKGSNNGNWNGGTTEINHYLREYISPWIKDSLKNGNYKCDISGNNGYLVVHHLYKNFKNIVEETFEITKLELKSHIKDYTQEELDLLSKTCLDLHYKYGLGVCILNNYHLDFHSFYGAFNNTPEQYYEFKQYIQEENQQSDSLLLCSNE